MRSAKQALAILLAVTSHLTAAIDLHVTDENSIKNASSIIAYDLMKYYTGNITNTPSTIGVLPKPYYWWEAGAMWGALLDYYHFTNDSSYNNVTTQALLSQVGPDWDYMVPAQMSDEGNDDQAFWGFSIMSAAEQDYPQPTIGNYSWIQLTENLWNTQVRRWDTTSCNGGLKWQIYPSNSYGYDYKNSVSNGAFFQLSARLARFTGNQTYVDWANKVYDWTYNIGLIDPNYQVFDGYNDLINCTGLPDELVWTYNVGIFLYGSAVLYNYTNGSSLWAERTEGFLNETANLFTPFSNATNIMYEPACETVNTCDTDQYSFKGYLSRFMWASTLLAPFTADAVYTLLADTSLAAAQACSGGEDGVTCGQKWYVGGYDGKPGVGQQMSALETIQGLLVSGSVPPLHSNQVHLKAAETTTIAPVPSRTATASPSKTNAASCGAPQVRGVLWFVVTAVAIRAFW